MALALSTICLSCVATTVWYLTEPYPPFVVNDKRLSATGDSARGQRVFAAGQCASCHASPGQPDKLKLGGGMTLPAPFGTFRPPNISPDPTDGIGTWTVSDLANALIAGVSPQREHYYPAFPYTSFTSMSLTDVEDLYAYLKTLPKVSGRAPPHRPTILFRIRRSVGFWKLLYFREGQSAVLLTGDPLHDRGGYLVESLAHCAECHSSRDAFGAIRVKTRFAGGIDPQGTGFVPNITPASLADWSESDIEAMLKTGDTPRHGRVGSSMADVVENISALSEDDRLAIARYLKSLPPRPTPHP
jgi:mono/diheme cytochrome c family protein